MTLIKSIYNRFPEKHQCLAYLETVRWSNNPICPYCNSRKSAPINTCGRYHCNWCNASYSVTVNSFLHKTKLDLQKWFAAISIVSSSHKPISSRGLAMMIGVNRNTAWYMLKRMKKDLISNRSLLERIAKGLDNNIN